MDSHKDTIGDIRISISLVLDDAVVDFTSQKKRAASVIAQLQPHEVYTFLGSDFDVTGEMLDRWLVLDIRWHESSTTSRFILTRMIDRPALFNYILEVLERYGQEPD